VQIRQFIDGIGRGAPPRVVLFCPGKAPWGREEWEPVLVDAALKRLFDAYVDPSLQDMTYSLFYADETPPGDIAQEARTFPFLAERRVIIVRNAERYNTMSAEKNAPLAHLTGYIEDPAETTLLVLVAAQIDRRKRFFKACEKGAVVVECPQLDDAAMRQWVSGEAESRRVKIDHAALTELLDRAGNRLSDVQNAFSLAANYVGNQGVITEADVRAACADVAEETVWALTDAIAASDTRKALIALHELIALNKAPDEILGTINWLVENAYRAMPETQAPAPKPFVATKVVKLGETLGLAKLKLAMAMCTRTQFNMRETGTDRNLALEMLVIKLSAGGAGKKRAAAGR
jgi:DNA polymerase-3 subunit delta